MNRPHVLLSAAMSADGYIDDASPQRLVLSGAADLDRVDEVRASCDAILVGAGTIRSDNPRLLVRSAARRDRRRGDGRPASPAKVTITGSGELDPAARFFADPQVPKLVYSTATDASLLAQRLDGLATVISGSGQDSLAWMLADLADRGTGRLMVEGGASVLRQFLAAGLADELQLAIAPVFVAQASAPRLTDGAVLAGRMELAGVRQVGDMAVLNYLPVRQARSEDAPGHQQKWPTR